MGVNSIRASRGLAGSRGERRGEAGRGGERREAAAGSGRTVLLK